MRWDRAPSIWRYSDALLSRFAGGVRAKPRLAADRVSRAAADAPVAVLHRSGAGVQGSASGQRQTEFAVDAMVATIGQELRWATAGPWRAGPPP